MDKKFKVEFKIKEFYYLLKSRKKQIILLGIITTILAIVVAFSIPRIYKARVVLAPETSKGTGREGKPGMAASQTRTVTRRSTITSGPANPSTRRAPMASRSG